jgi:hypothetical protein
MSEQGFHKPRAKSCEPVIILESSTSYQVIVNIGLINVARFLWVSYSWYHRLQHSVLSFFLCAATSPSTRLTVYDQCDALWHLGYLAGRTKYTN